MAENKFPATLTIFDSLFTYLFYKDFSIHQQCMMLGLLIIQIIEYQTNCHVHTPKYKCDDWIFNSPATTLSICYCFSTSPLEIQS